MSSVYSKFWSLLSVFFLGFSFLWFLWVLVFPLVAVFLEC